MKKKIVGIVVGVLAIATFISICYFVLMPLGGEFGKKSNEISRDVYETNPQYIKGKATTLAKYRNEYNLTDDFNTKKSICQAVTVEAKDFDTNDLNDNDLASFVKACRNGDYK